MKKISWRELVEVVEGEEVEGVFESVREVFELQEAVSRVLHGNEEMVIEDGRHLSHVMPSHFVFPDTKVFGDFVLPKEVDLLECIVSFFIGQPFLSAQELSLFIVVQGHSLTTNRHILARVSISVSHNLIVIRVLQSV